MDEAEGDVLSYAPFPADHWQKVWSNNPLERTEEVTEQPQLMEVRSMGPCGDESHT